MAINNELENLVTLDEDAFKNPIVMPGNVYIEALKDFGSDEALAGLVDLFGTSLANALLDPSIKNYVLPFVGPVTEKFMFFPLHLLKARKIYKTMPPSKRDTFMNYFKQAVSDGSENLFFDLTVHDPIYISAMGAGLHATDLHPAILSALAYGSAILLAAGIKVGKDELFFANKKRALRKAGFESEKYVESRFYIRAEKNPREIIDSLAREFGLKNSSTVGYHDKYFVNHFPHYSGRKVNMRLRRRARRSSEFSAEEKAGFVNSFQFVFTRVSEHQKQKTDQFRYFPSRKEKFYLLLDENVSDIEEIPNDQAKTLIKKYLSAPIKSYDINFQRTVVSNEELAVCSDSLRTGLDESSYVLELKVYKDIDLLQQAMRYLMMDAKGFVQTTLGKSELFTGSNGN